MAVKFEGNHVTMTADDYLRLHAEKYELESQCLQLKTALQSMQTVLGNIKGIII